MNSPVLPVRVDQIARTAWPYQSGSSVYGMIRNVGRLLDDARFKQFSSEHEERLAAVWPVSSSGISKMRRFRAGKGSVAGMVPSVYLLRRKASLFCRKLTPESS